ncbi:MAG: 4-(cytidine 5'-diphospho)-2-C-methyl-D-erythritol kinase, partial [Peptococcaceae bacterium]|nr:4-(cytidine 5'-diphospho)-2-C-methyl-D-erythritol kinase [Peptococcaceae bacterium]
SDIVLVVPGGEVSGGKDNLVYRAAELIKTRFGIQQGARIVLKKQIPLEAGLGGGSADAAAALRALSVLWGIHLSLAELIELGQQLGSDIPFCLLGGTALAKGRGEILEPLVSCPEMGVVVIKPPWGASTAAVYQAYDALAPVGGPDTAGMIEAIEKQSPADIAWKLINVLEAPVLFMYPAMNGIKERLFQAGALGVLMTGSGSAVFGITHSIVEAYGVAGRYSCAADEQVFITETLSIQDPLRKL